MKTLLILALLCAGTLAQFTSEAQDAIVAVHNTLRSKIAKGEYVVDGTSKPTASDMMKMKWDETVAASAQAYADECPTVFKAELGKNLFSYRTLTPLTNIDELGANSSVTWEKEFQDYGWKTNIWNAATYNTGIAHGVQMAWAETNLLGCGVKDCGMDNTGLYNVVVVCQYEPKSHFDHNIYTTGETCSECPSGTTCESECGLCV